MTSPSYPDPSQQELPRDAPSASGIGLNLLVLMARRRLLIGFVLLICLVLGITVALIVKPRFTAITTVLPPQQSSSSASGLLSQLGSLGAIAGVNSSVKSPVDIYGGMLQSQTVEDAMVKQFGLIKRYHVKLLSQARKKLEAQTSVDVKGKDGLLRVSVSDSSAQGAAELANGYIALTIELSQHLAVSEASQRRLFLENQLELAKNKLASAEEELKKTENSTGIIQVEAQGRALIQETATLQAEISQREAQLSSLKTFDADTNPDVQQIQQQLATMRKQLADLEGQAGEHSSGSTGQISNAGLEYIRKSRDVKYQEALFEILARQFEAAKIDEAREGALLQVIDPARVPDYRSGPSRLFIVLGFLIAGFVGVMAWLLGQLVWRQLLDDPVMADKIHALKAEFGLRGRKL